MGLNFALDTASISSDFNQIVDDLTTFLKPNVEKESKTRKLLGNLFKSLKTDGFQGKIKDLAIDGFDEEQVWTQLELDNKDHLDRLVSEIAHLTVSSSKKVKPVGSKRSAKQNLKKASDDLDDVTPHEADEDEEDDDSFDQFMEESGNLSTFQRDQIQLKMRTDELEEENLKKKPWRLVGEVTGDRRPENSLLEEAFQYDFVSRPAPIISEDTTSKIEEIIKQRIRDKTWDDVKRKQKPVELPFEYKRRLMLEQEKSKVGLAEVYEKDFLNRQQQEKKEDECEAHKEIKKLMSGLFIQLDAMSNYNFTPKPPEAEIKVISNLPTITAEEAIPITMSAGELLAPEEVLAKPKRPEKNETEKDSTDRKRERRLKKKKMKTRVKYQQEKNLKNVKPLSEDTVIKNKGRKSDKQRPDLDGKSRQRRPKDPVKIQA
ncbi:U3 small nucleolar ribonucleoprotein MPP10 [Brevipalpus obovatus]|uniref:U3 small nucleolar ribonucleoprotein MPP10 n=1 Tax=Brevipalpus obovatus TaxID=246614 RepID=UPI003D9DDDA8